MPEINLRLLQADPQTLHMHPNTRVHTCEPTTVQVPGIERDPLKEQPVPVIAQLLLQPCRDWFCSAV